MVLHQKIIWIFKKKSTKIYKVKKYKLMLIWSYDLKMKEPLYYSGLLRVSFVEEE